MHIHDCKIITLPKVEDQRGNLTYIESNNHIPFDIRRAFYIYDVPDGFSRGAHGHKELHQLVIPMSGSFDVTVDDGRHREKFQLKLPNFGLYIPPLIWSNLDNFSPGAVCMVLASDFYDEKDYYRNYDDFIEATRKKLDSSIS